MICAQCGTDNRSDRRFCMECGAGLARVCPACGTANEPNARFCGGCGSTLAGPDGGSNAAAPHAAGTAGTAPAQTAAAISAQLPATAQRRLISVLFADLVGFTPFAEERDPEEVRAVLTRYADISREIVARYGGTVEKFIGDAVMAVWGAPVAHEDDAERAVRAALELIDAVRALGAEIQARAGVLTGEAAVTVGATDQGLVAGDLVNTAARLQSAASPGTVLVGEATMHAAEASLAFEPAGEHTLKGKALPVRAWRALRVIAQRRGAGRSEITETPFVGRDEEFRLLRDVLHLAGRDPRARLVSVTGPGGIGKSRLAWELEKYIDGVVEPIYWHRGRCPAYGDGVAFWALGEMVRRRCGLVEGADEAETRRRVSEKVAEFVDDESERAWIESALLVLLGIEPNQSVAQELLFAAWRRFFEQIAQRGTTVLVFEDLQWADPALLDFIDHLLDWSKGAPLLIITLARPELFDRRPDWGAGRRTFTAIALEPLPQAAMLQLLAGLVPELPAAAAVAIASRADGIPLYAVETVRMLLADGRLEQVNGSYRPTGSLETLAVPETLRSLIASRLDGLEPADRALVEDASVLGQTFGIDALAAVRGTTAGVLEPHLRRLLRREILTLEADPRAPERGQYSFVQSLIREVAYATLARPDRRAKHLSAARFYEATGTDEVAAVLAAHYVAAHQNSAPGAEADTVAAQARVALRGAADRAAALGGREQATNYLKLAVEVTADPMEKAALQEAAATQADLAGHYVEAEALARAALETYDLAPDRGDSARARGVLGTSLIHASHIQAAIEELEKARTELPENAAAATRADVLAKLARAYYRNVESKRSLAVADEALVIAQAGELRQTIAEALVTKGTALSMERRLYEALALLRAGIALALREGAVAIALRGMANIPGLVANEDGSDAAWKVMNDAIDLAQAAGDRGQLVWHLGNLGFGTIFGGRPLGPTIERMSTALEMQLEPSDWMHLASRRTILRGLAGEDVSSEWAEVMLVIEKTGDPQVLADAAWGRALTDFAAGRCRDAAEAFARVGEGHRNYESLPLAVVSAVLTGDRSFADAMLVRMEAIPPGGATDRVLREAMYAALMVADGHRDEGLARFHQRSPRGALGNEFIVALGDLAVLHALGDADSESRALGERALMVFERMGSVPLAALVREMIGKGAAQGAIASV